MLALQNHRAVVTGASSGIGKEFARQLAAQGCALILVARRLNRLEELATELRATYAIPVECIELDLNIPQASQTLFERATRSHQEITILINNAGVGRYGAFTDFPIADHLTTVRLNSIVPLELSYYFIKHMLQLKRPCYIGQISSIAALQPVSYFTVYSASKSFLLLLSETISFELKNSNVSMTCICPGGTATEFFQSAGQKITHRGQSTLMTVEQVVQGSLRALFKRKRTYVPGFLNQLACFLPRLFPRKLSLLLAFKIMNQAVERVTPRVEKL